MISFHLCIMQTSEGAQNNVSRSGKTTALSSQRSHEQQRRKICYQLHSAAILLKAIIWIYKGREKHRSIPRHTAGEECHVANRADCCHTGLTALVNYLVNYRRRPASDAENNLWLGSGKDSHLNAGERCRRDVKSNALVSFNCWSGSAQSGVTSFQGDIYFQSSPNLHLRSANKLCLNWSYLESSGLQLD